MADGTVPGADDPAPDFTLPDTHGTPTHLADLRGEPVLVVFFPFAFSGTCTAELGELRDHAGEFEAAGVRILAVSTDPVFTLRAWQEVEGFGFDLLSDFWPHGRAAQAFGVFDRATGHALRGSFLIDADGLVRWSTVLPRGARRDLDDYLAALAEV
ncbi:peroxiredoxin [Isoptericola sediminis]|uniref:Peroxiredoxin n=1 Tax=Isoptericola sediminis TaxID=2733572 RepID=A0A849K555_9MICO|nr:peroxiredoxin [Isoptericola sediminis]NNU28478.1 peroxiredoxin [Isoptericola sediminis]